MAKKILFTISIIIIFQSLLGQDIANIEKIRIHSKELNQNREILVYTPQSYNELLFSYYDVIYVFDSQNRELFDFTHSILSFLTSTKFIVVGIISPYYEKTDYGRNNDMLPFPKNTDIKKFYNGYAGNADNFLNYVKNEVIPFIDSRYRTLNNRTAIGHSLSASFIIYSLFNEPDLFDNYIAISPNFAYDKERLVDDLYNFDFNKIKNEKYLYLSNADEGIDYWEEWIPAREKVYSFFEDSLYTDKLKVEIKDYSEESHWNSFAPSLKSAFEYYFENIYEKQKNKLSTEEYEVNIIVKVPNKNDEIFITGNQENLGNWIPDKIKLNRISDFERQIIVKLHFPAQLKFTKGSWETEADVENCFSQNIIINNPKKLNYKFEIKSYLNE